MKYEHLIDKIIIDGLKHNERRYFTNIYNLISKHFPKVSKTTVQRHLEKLSSSKSNTIIMKKTDVKRLHNETYYSLSDKARIELEYFGGIERYKSHRESKNSDKNKDPIDEIEIRKRIYFLLLTQASRGSTRIVSRSPEEQSKAGDIYEWDPKESRYVSKYYSSISGVTSKDLTHKRDRGMGVFRNVDFTLSTVEDCINVLKKDGVYDLLILPSYRSGDGGEIGIEIKDSGLKDLVDNIACFMWPIMSRVEDVWLYKSKPRASSWEFKWYNDFFGRDKTINIINKSRLTRRSLRNAKNKKELLDFIRSDLRNKASPTEIQLKAEQDLESIIYKKKKVDSDLFLYDRYVVRLYHERILCDRYMTMPPEYRHNYDKYCSFVRDILNRKNRYHAVISKLIDFVYPIELRRFHEKNKNLKKFINTLPDRPTSAL